MGSVTPTRNHQSTSSSTAAAPAAGGAALLKQRSNLLQFAAQAIACDCHNQQLLPLLLGEQHCSSNSPLAPLQMQLKISAVLQLLPLLLGEQHCSSNNHSVQTVYDTKSGACVIMHRHSIHLNTSIPAAVGHLISHQRHSSVCIPCACAYAQARHSRI
jgi:hypothetical protein